MDYASIVKGLVLLLLAVLAASQVAQRIPGQLGRAVVLGGGTLAVHEDAYSVHPLSNSLLFILK